MIFFQLTSTASREEHTRTITTSRIGRATASRAIIVVVAVRVTTGMAVVALAVDTNAMITDRPHHIGEEVVVVVEVVAAEEQTDTMAAAAVDSITIETVGMVAAAAVVVESEVAAVAIGC